MEDRTWTLLFAAGALAASLAAAGCTTVGTAADRTGEVVGGAARGAGEVAGDAVEGTGDAIKDTTDAAKDEVDDD